MTSFFRVLVPTHFAFLLGAAARASQFIICLFNETLSLVFMKLASIAFLRLRSGLQVWGIELICGHFRQTEHSFTVCPYLYCTRMSTWNIYNRAWCFYFPSCAPEYVLLSSCLRTLSAVAQGERKKRIVRPLCDAARAGRVARPGAPAPPPAPGADRTSHTSCPSPRAEHTPSARHVTR
jgi:hypothetical protein